MKTRSETLRRPALLLAALLLAGTPTLRAQIPTEGYDPLRQITEQLTSANLLIVQDVTGSMGWDYTGRVLTYQHNSTGNVFWNSGCWFRSEGCEDAYRVRSSPVPGENWGVGGRTVPEFTKEDCNVGATQCRVWNYVLLYERPSRLAIVKNAMGNSVSLVTAYVPPPFNAAGSTGVATWNSTSDPGAPFTGDWGTTPNGATVTAFAWDPARQSRVQFWVYQIDYGFQSNGNPRRGTDPGKPFVAWSAANSTDNRPGINVAGNGCAVGTCTYEPPRNVIGRNQNRVNWGLLTYSTDNQNDSSPNDGINGEIRVYDVDPRGGNPNLDRILNAYRLSQRVSFGTWSVADGHAEGLVAQGSTNTRTALFKTDADGTRVKGANHSLERTKTLAECPAPYGVILVTDGESNTGNTAASGCGSVSSSWDRCYENWFCYPAGGADSLYGLFDSTREFEDEANPHVNTWAIGISRDVGRCELNFTAYAGRTDASSPRGDAGYSGYAAATASDPGNPYVAEAPQEPSAGGAHYDASAAHGDNAFFPEDSEEVSDAIISIVNATATGDYATNAPVSGMTVSQASIVFLPSTEYPAWDGHLYSFDTRYAPNDAKYLNENWKPTVWNTSSTRPNGDAAEILNEMPSDKRKIFTWNPAAGNALVEITASNLATLQTLGGAGVTAAVVDFIRGNDGAGAARPWRLGPVINSAPAIVGPPQAWLQGTTITHKPFEATYGGRTALLWVGANTGMMHAFRVDDGVEQIALVPPSLLPMQAKLYENYVNDSRNPKNPAGQVPDPDKHVYGVANSFRFGDVWDASLSTPGYRTVGIITTGPSGDDVVGVDVTSVPSPTEASYPAAPVKILWAKDSASMAGLQQTWSIPAMAPASSDTWRLIMGSGFRPENTADAQTNATGFVQPKAFTLDPTNGTLITSLTLSSTSAYTPFVGSQAFADTVLFNTTAKVYQEDNVATLGLQADLNGQIWFLYNAGSQIRFDSSRVGINASAKVGQSQPIYYNPAASGYGQGLAGCVAYAFGSGTLYERSAAVTGRNRTFVPHLYVATASKASPTAAVPAGNIIAKPIRDTTTPWKLVEGTTETNIVFGPNTQLTAPPFMLVPRSGKGSVTALYLLYDPDEGCRGTSYVAVIDFIGGDSCQPTNTTTFKAFNAGEGAASGFTIAGDRVLVAKSGVGEGQRAGLYEPPGIAATVGGVPEPKVKWWKELK